MRNLYMELECTEASYKPKIHDVFSYTAVLRRSLVRASNRALRFNESSYFLSSPPPLYEWPNSGHVPKVAVHWAGGECEGKKGTVSGDR